MSSARRQQRLGEFLQHALELGKAPCTKLPFPVTLDRGHRVANRLPHGFAGLGAGGIQMVGTIEEIRLGQLVVRFLLEGAASDGSIAMFEFDVPAGAKVPIPHSHDGYEETVYGLAGVLTWTVDGVRHDVGVGEVLCIPRGGGASLREPRQPGCDQSCRGDARRAQSGLFPGAGGAGGCRGRRSTGPRGDGRGDAAARPDTGAFPAVGPRGGAARPR